MSSLSPFSYIESIKLNKSLSDNLLSFSISSFIASATKLSSILLIVVIVLITRLIKTLTKVDKIVEDVEYKVSKLNGVFNIIDTMSDTITKISDTLSSAVYNGINKVLKRKGNDKDE